MSTAERVEMTNRLLQMGIIHPDEAIIVLNLGKLDCSVDEWMTVPITPYLKNKYENAKIAAEIRNSPLMKAMK